MIETWLIIWNAGLTIWLFTLIFHQNNITKLLEALSNDLNQAKICDGRIVTRYKNGDMKIDLTECSNVQHIWESDRK